MMMLTYSSRLIDLQNTLFAHGMCFALFLSPLLLPVYGATLSLLTLSIHGIIRRKQQQSARRAKNGISANSVTHQTIINGHEDASSENIKPVLPAFARPSKTVIVLRTLRLLGCLTLTGLTLAILLAQLSHPAHDGSNRDAICYHWKSGVGYAAWVEISLASFYAYASALSILALVSNRVSQPLSTRPSAHLTILLLVAFVLFAYRDVWPLATYNLTPADGNGTLGWIRIVLLGVVAVVIPLITPRQYIPIDPIVPAIPAPEQIASPLSMIFYFYMDNVVLDAYRKRNLTDDSIPALPDYDHSIHLKEKHFKLLDPLAPTRMGKRTSLFWKLMRVFQREYTILALCSAARAFTVVTSPIAMNRLLNHLENGGNGATIRPWVWIILIFLSPVGTSITLQTYLYFATRGLVRAEALITQLIFEHALRIRMGEDTDSPGDSAPSKSGDKPSTPRKKTEVPSAPNTKGKSKNLVGKINNLISSDLGNITEARDFVMVTCYTPVVIVICIIFLWNLLQWAAILGFVVMLLAVPIPTQIAKLMTKVQHQRMKLTDARVQTVTEMIGVIRMVKLFGWESKAKERIARSRDEELKYLKKRNLLNVLNYTVNRLVPVLTMIISLAFYTVFMRQRLSPSKVFSAITVFEVFRDQVQYALRQLPLIIQAIISMQRTESFLQETELLDIHSNSDSHAAFLTPDTASIGFRNASFYWRSDGAQSGTPTPSRRNFNLTISGELFFHRGEINLICGPTGCGKTSLLMALLGELHFHPSALDSWFNLPRQGGISYAAQEPWIQNATIKDNIVFGSEFDLERYEKVIYQCGLEPDLELFEHGDETEVGERGLTLSGGQKARVSLARAIYSRAEIILLDDVLSALDVHTSRWAVEKCLSGDIVRGRTVILITHSVALVGPVASFAVLLSQDGRVAKQGPIQDVLSQDILLPTGETSEAPTNEMANQKDIAGSTARKPSEGSGTGSKLIRAEEKAQGHVAWSAMRMYFTNMGGLGFWLLVLMAIFFSVSTNILNTWWLGFWASRYEHEAHVNAFYYLGASSLLALAGVAAYFGGNSSYFIGAIRASRILHQKLAESVVGTTLRWLDSTPVGRIIYRFTQDMRAIDISVANNLQSIIEWSITLSMQFFAIVYNAPAYVVPATIVGVLGGLLGQIYMMAQLPIKREMSNARSPVMSHFGAGIHGLVSIRAYGVEDVFKNESLRRIDVYSRAARTFYDLNRWVCIRMDILGGCFSSGLAAYLVYGHSGAPSNQVGFSLSMAIAFSGLILWWIRTFNELVQGNSLERLESYIEIEQEPKATESGRPPASWPTSGLLHFSELSARYAQDSPEILHRLSFTIRSGERVGVVGRTGSGKSSLMLSLLRMIPTSGSIRFDGLDINHVNLDILRTSVTIIPQQPELMSGTVRENLDPFSQNDDLELNNALRASGLFKLQEGLDESEKITLDTIIASLGSNLSLGQRQVIALARAIVRRSKVLILDEATAAIDHDTDAHIQATIRHELHDCTLITVAHRLQTIMDYDKILVLDAGHLVEFDTPRNLLAKEGSVFKALVDRSGDKEKLIKLAQ